MRLVYRDRNCVDCGDFLPLTLCECGYQRSRWDEFWVVPRFARLAWTSGAPTPRLPLSDDGWAVVRDFAWTELEGQGRIDEDPDPPLVAPTNPTDFAIQHLVIDTSPIRDLVLAAGPFGDDTAMRIMQSMLAVQQAFEDATDLETIDAMLRAQVMSPGFLAMLRMNAEIEDATNRAMAQVVAAAEQEAERAEFTADVHAWVVQQPEVIAATAEADAAQDPDDQQAAVARLSTIAGRLASEEVQRRRGR